MAGGEQHAGDAEDALGAARLELFQAVTDDRAGKLQEAALDVVVGQAFAEMDGEFVEFVDGVVIAAAVAADHDGGLGGSVHGAWSLPSGDVGAGSMGYAGTAASAWSWPPNGRGGRTIGNGGRPVTRRQ